MSDWKAFIEDDVEGNVCIYLQDFRDQSSRELYEIVGVRRRRRAAEASG